MPRRKVKINPKRDGAIQRIVNPVAAAKGQVGRFAPKMTKALDVLEKTVPGEQFPNKKR